MKLKFFYLNASAKANGTSGEVSLKVDLTDVFEASLAILRRLIKFSQKSLCSTNNLVSGGLLLILMSLIVYIEEMQRNKIILDLLIREEYISVLFCAYICTESLVSVMWELNMSDYT